MIQQVSERTESEYRGRLRAAGFGEWDAEGAPEWIPADLSKSTATWGQSSKNVLKAAYRRQLELAGMHEDQARDMARRLLPRAARVRHAKVRPPSADDVEKAESILSTQSPANQAAFTLLAELGLRADSLLNLQRRDVESAVAGGDLIFRVKGGSDQALPVEPAVCEALEKLLASPRKGSLDRKWKVLGEVFSERGYSAAYKSLWRNLRAIGKEIKAPLRPHKLRHYFASRLHESSGDPLVVKAALGHSNLATTMRYIDISRGRLKSAFAQMSKERPQAVKPAADDASE